MEYDLILVRYNEIALKSGSVRERFEKRLLSNIEDAFAVAGETASIERAAGRFYVYPQNFDAALLILGRIFGIYSFSPAIKCSSDLEDIRRSAAAFALKSIKPGQSFAVRPKRTGSGHPYTSQELGRDVGDAVNEATGASVNLTNPDFELFAEVRDNKAFVFSGRLHGPGGMPYGTQGRVVAVVDSMDGALAAYLMAKRGCEVILMAPDSDGDSPSAAGAALESLKPWIPKVKMCIIDHKEDFKEIAAASAPACARVLSKRQLLRKAELLARFIGYDAIVTGERLSGSEESGDDICLTDSAASMTVLRPLTGFYGKRLIALSNATRIGLEADHGNGPENLGDCRMTVGELEAVEKNCRAEETAICCVEKRRLQG